MITFHNESREGRSPKYYILHRHKQRLLSSVFSSRKYWEKNKDLDSHLGHKFIAGELSEFTRPYEILDSIIIPQASLRGDKDKNYLPINPLINGNS